jgi:hypothetical protein
MTLPEIRDDEDAPAHQRRVVTSAVIGGAVALALVVVGLVVLGMAQANSGEVAATGLSSIGATLAGGFAGWIARGQVRQ